MYEEVKTSQLIRDTLDDLKVSYKCAHSPTLPCLNFPAQACIMAWYSRLAVVFQVADPNAQVCAGGHLPRPVSLQPLARDHQLLHFVLIWMPCLYPSQRVFHSEARCVTICSKWLLG